jgi:hypothetical protein
MNSLFAPVQWLLFLALWRMSYEAANIPGTPPPVKSFLVQSSSPAEDPKPVEKEWAAKAVKRYADAQEKKWQRWNEAMFEAK